MPDEVDDLEAAINESLHDELDTPGNATTSAAANTATDVVDSETTSVPAPGPAESNAATAAQTDVGTAAQPTDQSVTDAAEQTALLRAQIAERDRLIESNATELAQLRQQQATTETALAEYTDEEIEDLELRLGEDIAQQLVLSRRELVLARQERMATLQSVEQSTATTHEEQYRSVMSEHAPTVHKWRLEWQAQKDGEAHPQFEVAQKIHGLVTGLYPDWSQAAQLKEVEKRTLIELGQQAATTTGSSTTREIGGHQVVDTTVPDSLNGVPGVTQVSGDAALQQKIMAGGTLTEAEEIRAGELLGF